MTQTVEQIEKDVNGIVEEGTVIYRKVRCTTLKALTEHELDTNNIQRVIDEVCKG